MEGHSVISPDVLARYAADAAAEVPGVHTKQRRGARVVGQRGRGARSSSTTAPTSRTSRPRCSGASSTTSSGWRTSRRPRSMSSSTTSRDKCRAAASDRTDEADARDGADRLPRVHLVADPRPAHDRQGPVDGEGRARLRRVGDGLLRRRRARARLDAVRAGAGVPARGGAAGRAAVGRLDPRHVRVPRRPVEPVGAAVALPRRDRRGARPRRGVPRGVLVPLSRRRVGLRAVPRPPDGVPAGLPRRLRLPGGALRRPGRAVAARARRAAAGGGRHGARRCSRRAQRVRCPGARARSRAAAV